MADRETNRDLGAAHNAPVTPDPASTASPDPVERGHLRDQIDSGKFRDKVAAPDPAASPLGTDDEAAGRTDPGQLPSGMKAHRRLLMRQRVPTPKNTPPSSQGAA